MSGSQITAPTLQPRLRRPLERPVIYYPGSDGEPMADSDPQYRCITDTRFGLEQYYHDNLDVYVGADLLIYYMEGDVGKNVAPDVLVSLDVPKGNAQLQDLG